MTRRSKSRGILGLAAVLAMSSPLPAQSGAGSGGPAPQAAQGPPVPAPPGPPIVAPDVVTRVPENPVTIGQLPAPRRFVTRHETTIRGQRIRYTATAGETYITNLYGHPIASFFSFAYVRDGSPDPSRPVLFVFNGGPGSSSMWLHMGAVGPHRLVLDQEVDPSNTPPFEYQDNPHSVLDVADLVFVDPVGTGFSQAIGNAINSDFYGVDEDADSVARFIEAWLTENGRWNSPKFLMGESYGSVRAAVLPRALMGAPLYTGVMRGITVDGIVLLGIALNLSTQPDSGAPPTAPNPRDGRAIPAFAATAWYHNRVDRAGRSIEQYYREVSDFAASEYAEAVYRLRLGTLTDAAKAQVADRLAAYTGVPADLWLSNDLTISSATFLSTVIAEQGLAAGNYDSRYTLPLAPSGNDPVADDPAMGRYVPGFVSAFHQMLRDDLGVTMPMPYNAITWATLNFNWRWTRIGPPVGRSYGDELAIAMRRNPRLRVLAASGYYDVTTTAAAAEIDILQAGLPRDRVTIRNYESGHMLYLGDTADDFANDVRALIERR